MGCGCSRIDTLTDFQFRNYARDCSVCDFGNCGGCRRLDDFAPIERPSITPGNLNGIETCPSSFPNDCVSDAAEFYCALDALTFSETVSFIDLCAGTSILLPAYYMYGIPENVTQDITIRCSSEDCAMTQMANDQDPTDFGCDKNCPFFSSLVPGQTLTSLGITYTEAWAVENLFPGQSLPATCDENTALGTPGSDFILNAGPSDRLVDLNQGSLPFPTLDIMSANLINVGGAPAGDDEPSEMPSGQPSQSPSESPSGTPTGTTSEAEEEEDSSSSPQKKSRHPKKFRSKPPITGKLKHIKGGPAADEGDKKAGKSNGAAGKRKIRRRLESVEEQEPAEVGLEMPSQVEVRDNEIQGENFSSSSVLRDPAPGSPEGRIKDFVSCVNMVATNGGVPSRVVPPSSLKKSAEDRKMKNEVEKINFFHVVEATMEHGCRL
uniref:Uncharacterized protein n=1 Tax=Entomoneis paludosa TaxID=265537 RepID=A0A7S3DND4_9STRA|mmetsp:Transcript_23178/g.48247  ORF Transcript_23178/g.48247 Transcript_23178/m.48247 type:complete len:436 (+) Transcript_23178:689-1996(+)